MLRETRLLQTLPTSTLWTDISTYLPQLNRTSDSIYIFLQSFHVMLDFRRDTEIVCPHLIKQRSCSAVKLSGCRDKCWSLGCVWQQVNILSFKLKCFLAFSSNTYNEWAVQKVLASICCLSLGVLIRSEYWSVIGWMSSVWICSVPVMDRECIHCDPPCCLLIGGNLQLRPFNSVLLLQKTGWYECLQIQKFYL